MIYFTYSIINNILLTEAKQFKDATNNPPIFRLKALLPICNRNNISFCICNGALYQRTLYLQTNNETTNR